MAGALVNVCRVLFLANELAKDDDGVDAGLDHDVLRVVQDSGRHADGGGRAPFEQGAGWLGNLHQG